MLKLGWLYYQLIVLFQYLHIFYNKLSLITNTNKTLTKTQFFTYNNLLYYNHTQHFLTKKIGLKILRGKKFAMLYYSFYFLFNILNKYSLICPINTNNQKNLKMKKKWLQDTFLKENVKLRKKILNFKKIRNNVLIKQWKKVLKKKALQNLFITKNNIITNETNQFYLLYLKHTFIHRQILLSNKLKNFLSNYINLYRANYILDSLSKKKSFLNNLLKTNKFNFLLDYLIIKKKKNFKQKQKARIHLVKEFMYPHKINKKKNIMNGAKARKKTITTNIHMSFSKKSKKKYIIQHQVKSRKLFKSSDNQRIVTKQLYPTSQYFPFQKVGKFGNTCKLFPMERILKTSATFYLDNFRCALKKPWDINKRFFYTFHLIGRNKKEFIVDKKLIRKTNNVLFNFKQIITYIRQLTKKRNKRYLFKQIKHNLKRNYKKRFLHESKENLLMYLKKKNKKIFYKFYPYSHNKKLRLFKFKKLTTLSKYNKKIYMFKYVLFFYWNMFIRNNYNNNYFLKLRNKKKKKGYQLRSYQTKILKKFKRKKKIILFSFKRKQYNFLFRKNKVKSKSFVYYNLKYLIYYLLKHKYPRKKLNMKFINHSKRINMFLGKMNNEELLRSFIKSMLKKRIKKFEEIYFFKFFYPFFNILLIKLLNNSSLLLNIDYIFTFLHIILKKFLGVKKNKKIQSKENVFLFTKNTLNKKIFFYSTKKKFFIQCIKLLKSIILLQMKQEHSFWKIFYFKKRNNLLQYITKINNFNMLPSRTLITLFIQPKPISFDKFFLRKGYHQFSYYIERIINYYTGLIYYFFLYINLKNYLLYKVHS